MGCKGDREAWRYDPKFKPFYKSAAWRKVRSAVWDRAHGLCERCMERGVVEPAEVVHHKTPLNSENVNDPDISLNPDRLIALCHNCHTEVHQELGIGSMNGRIRHEGPRVGFDSEGNLVRL